MNYTNFQEVIINKVQEVFFDQLENSTVSIKTVKKNNGTKLTGLTIVSKNSKIVPVIYLESFYDDYKNGKSLEEITNNIGKAAFSNMFDESIGEIFSRYNLIRDKITMNVVNKERNKELLEKIPHKTWKDLAIIYKVILDETDEGTATVTITNKHLEMWNIDAEDLHRRAILNKSTISPTKIIPMMQLLNQMMMQEMGISEMEEGELEEMEDNLPMYVLTNKKKSYGAAAMFDKDALKNLANKLESNLYILPSSVHEIICIPEEEGMDPLYIREMVKEVNMTSVSEEEYLSDNIYYYDRETNKLSLKEEA